MISKRNGSEVKVISICSKAQRNCGDFTVRISPIFPLPPDYGETVHRVPGGNIVVPAVTLGPFTMGFGTFTTGNLFCLFVCLLNSSHHGDRRKEQDFHPN